MNPTIRYTGGRSGDDLYVYDIFGVDCFYTENDHLDGKVYYRMCDDGRCFASFSDVELENIIEKYREESIKNYELQKGELEVEKAHHEYHVAAATSRIGSLVGLKFTVRKDLIKTKKDSLAQIEKITQEIEEIEKKMCSIVPKSAHDFMKEAREARSLLKLCLTRASEDKKIIDEIEKVNGVIVDLVAKNDQALAEEESKIRSIVTNPTQLGAISAIAENSSYDKKERDMAEVIVRLANNVTRTNGRKQ